MCQVFAVTGKVCTGAHAGQEREAAKQLPGTTTAADNTFEPGEGMTEAASAPTGDQAMPGMLSLGCDCGLPQPAF